MSLLSRVLPMVLFVIGCTGPEDDTSDDRTFVPVDFVDTDASPIVDIPSTKTTLTVSYISTAPQAETRLFGGGLALLGGVLLSAEGGDVPVSEITLPVMGNGGGVRASFDQPGWEDEFDGCSVNALYSDLGYTSTSSEKGETSITFLLEEDVVIDNGTSVGFYIQCVPAVKEQLSYSPHAYAFDVPAPNGVIHGADVLVIGDRNGLPWPSQSYIAPYEDFPLECVDAVDLTAPPGERLWNSTTVNPRAALIDGTRFYRAIVEGAATVSLEILAGECNPEFEVKGVSVSAISLDPERPLADTDPLRDVYARTTLCDGEEEPYGHAFARLSTNGLPLSDHNLGREWNEGMDHMSYFGGGQLTGFRWVWKSAGWTGYLSDGMQVDLTNLNGGGELTLDLDPTVFDAGLQGPTVSYQNRIPLQVLVQVTVEYYDPVANGIGYTETTDHIFEINSRSFY